MANEFQNAQGPRVTREMLAAKIDELKSSATQLEGHQLGHVYGIVSSISKNPYQFHIKGPVKILPDWGNPDWTAEVAGPVHVPPPKVPTLPTSVAGPIVFPADDNFRFVAVGSAEDTPGATLECPHCKHKLTIHLSLSL
jgi:hypothetical protein